MISLYKSGNSHTVRGVVCEIGRFPAAKLSQRLGEGWFTCPTQIDEKLTTNKQIRAKAKELGIESSDKARISTLKELIDAKG